MPPEVQKEIEALRREIAQIREDSKRDIREHQHNGLQAQLVDLDVGIDGLFETVSVAPTNIPKSIYDQVKVYRSGATLRLYIYDVDNQAWRYVALT